MAGGPSTPELTAAVARAGGFGFLAAGYLSAAQLVASIGAMRELSGAPFGVNIFCPSAPADPEPVRRFAGVIQPESDRLGVPLGEPRWDDDAFGDKLEIVESEHVDVVSFTFGCPRASAIDDLHGANCRVAITVTSREEAQFAENAGADLLVVQGTEAGGHQGSFLSLAPNVSPLLPLVEEIRESTGIPLVGSGGIMTGARAAEVLDKGAIGVQLGTAFLCSPEAGTSATYRRALLDKTYPETLLHASIQWPLRPRPGQPVRAQVRRVGARGLSRGPPPHSASPRRRSPSRRSKHPEPLGRFRLARCCLSTRPNDHAADSR